MRNKTKNRFYLLDYFEIFHYMNNNQNRERVEHIKQQTEFGFVKPIPKQYAKYDQNQQKMVAASELDFL